MIEEKLHAEGASRYIPVDVVARVLRVLPARSVARSRCVCKEWRSLTHDHRFIDEHCMLWASDRRSLLALPTWLRLSLYRFGPNHDVFEGVSECHPDKLMYHTLSNPVNGLIAAFCFTFVSVQVQCHHPTLQPYLINPITRDHLRVPGGTWQDDLGPLHHLGLGFDSSTGAYKLACLRSIHGFRGPGACMVLTVGADGAWRRVERHAPFGAVAYSPPVFLDGAVYWLATTADQRWSWSILAFDVEDEELRVVPMPNTQLEGTPEHLLHLRDLEGSLCFVECSFDNGSPPFRVWKLEGQPGQQYWRLEHVISPSEWLGRVESRCVPWVVDIRGGKEAILQNFGAVWSYDLGTKTLLKFRQLKSVSRPLFVISGTLVSPTTLLQA